LTQQNSEAIGDRLVPLEGGVLIAKRNRRRRVAQTARDFSDGRAGWLAAAAGVT
jgi:hypothetical protein